MALTIDSPLAADFAKLIEQRARPSTPVNFQPQSETSGD